MSWLLENFVIFSTTWEKKIVYQWHACCQAELRPLGEVAAMMPGPRSVNCRDRQGWNIIKSEGKPGLYGNKQKQYKFWL